MDYYFFLNASFKEKMIKAAFSACWSAGNRRGGFLLFQVWKACICLSSVQHRFEL